jgi:hypothetical protein
MQKDSLDVMDNTLYSDLEIMEKTNENFISSKLSGIVLDPLQSYKRDLRV